MDGLAAGFSWTVDQGVNEGTSKGDSGLYRVKEL